MGIYPLVALLGTHKIIRVDYRVWLYQNIQVTLSVLIKNFLSEVPELKIGPIFNLLDPPHTCLLYLLPDMEWVTPSSCAI